MTTIEVDDTFNRPIGGASFSLDQGGPALVSGTTDTNGEYSFTVADGTYHYVISASGYSTLSGQLIITSGVANPKYFQLGFAAPPVPIDT